MIVQGRYHREHNACIETTTLTQVLWGKYYNDVAQRNIKGNFDFCFIITNRQPLQLKKNARLTTLQAINSHLTSKHNKHNKHNKLQTTINLKIVSQARSLSIHSKSLHWQLIANVRELQTNAKSSARFSQTVYQIAPESDAYINIFGIASPNVNIIRMKEAHLTVLITGTFSWIQTHASYKMWYAAALEYILLKSKIGLYSTIQHILL